MQKKRSYTLPDFLKQNRRLIHSYKIYNYTSTETDSINDRKSIRNYKSNVQSAKSWGIFWRRRGWHFPFAQRSIDSRRSLENYLQNLELRDWGGFSSLSVGRHRGLFLYEAGRRCIPCWTFFKELRRGQKLSRQSDKKIIYQDIHIFSQIRRRNISLS